MQSKLGKRGAHTRLDDNEAKKSHNKKKKKYTKEKVEAALLFVFASLCRLFFSFGRRGSFSVFVLSSSSSSFASGGGCFACCWIASDFFSIYFISHFHNPRECAKKINARRKTAPRHNGVEGEETYFSSFFHLHCGLSSFWCGFVVVCKTLDSSFFTGLLVVFLFSAWERRTVCMERRRSGNLSGYRCLVLVSLSSLKGLVCIRKTQRLRARH